MVGTSFGIPAILFYLASDANKNMLGPLHQCNFLSCSVLHHGGDEFWYSCHNILPSKRRQQKHAGVTYRPSIALSTPMRVHAARTGTITTLCPIVYHHHLHHQTTNSLAGDHRTKHSLLPHHKRRIRPPTIRITIHCFIQIFKRPS